VLGLRLGPPVALAPVAALLALAVLAAATRIPRLDGAAVTT
jgi:hypothetical protein